MEPPGEKPVIQFPLNKILEITEKIEVLGNTVLFAVILICTLSYIEHHIGAFIRRIRLIQQGIAEITRDYCAAQNYDDEDAEYLPPLQMDQIERLLNAESILPYSSTSSCEDDIEELLNGEWDYGENSDDDDEYKTDDEEVLTILADEIHSNTSCTKCPEGLVKCTDKYRTVHERFDEVCRISNEIVKDEYLLSKGFIKPAEFGKNVMKEF